MSPPNKHKDGPAGLLLLVNGAGREKRQRERQASGEGGEENGSGGRKERNGNALFDPPSLALGELPSFTCSGRPLPLPLPLRPALPPPRVTVRCGCRLRQVCRTTVKMTSSHLMQPRWWPGSWGKHDKCQQDDLRHYSLTFHVTYSTPLNLYSAK